MSNTGFIRSEIPDAFLERMAVMLGDEYSSFCDSLLQPAVSGLRVNTLKITPGEFLTAATPTLSPVPWCPAGFTLHKDIDEVAEISPGKHTYHAAGLYYLQEPSAMAAAEILAPQPGERVLDLCAAPGGKATHLAALMKNSGALVANEIHPKRVWDLAENLERCGVTNTIITNETPEKLAGQLGEYFDRVLLDAPCSGEGMFRKGEVARREWKPGLVASCAARQASILEQAARLVKPGGRLAYTTCTFSAEENEGVIAGFLDQHPEYEILQIPLVEGFSPAVPNWVSLPADNRLTRAIRIWPHRARGEGHFIALLEKLSHTGATGMVAGRSRSNQKNPSTPLLPRPIIPIVDEFIHGSLAKQFDTSHLILDGSFIYQQPEEPFSAGNIKLIRRGWWIGTIKGDRFIPSHSFAMGIKSGTAKRTLQLSPSDSRLAAYLSGESLNEPGENGWVLITVDCYPVGWGKRVQNVIKNYYPHGLRKPS